MQSLECKERKKDRAGDAGTVDMSKGTGQNIDYFSSEFLKSIADGSSSRDLDLMHSFPVSTQHLLLTDFTQCKV